jgi:predicted TIM-barrel fold metal-dependent hydrolase
MVIDCHSHLVPKSWYNEKSPPAIFDIPRLLEEQDRAGVNLTVFGNNWIRTPQGADSLEVVKQFNEFAAEATSKHPGRLLGLASSVAFGDNRMLEETERAVRGYGLKGVMVNSSVEGEYLDSPRATPFFELVAELNVPLFVHPPARAARPAVRHDALAHPLYPGGRHGEIPDAQDRRGACRRRAADAARAFGLRL